MKKTLMSLSLILIVVLALTGCYEWPDPIWNPDEEGLAVPTITGVDATTLLGGIDNITITGTGFGDVAEEVLVYFKKGTTVGRGRTLSASDTELIVEAPPAYSDSLEIWIDRRGCLEYAKFTSSLITISQGQVSLPIVTTSVLNKIAVNELGTVIASVNGSQTVYEVGLDDSISAVPNVVFSPTQNVLAMRMKGDDLYYTLGYYIVKYDGAQTREKANNDRNAVVDFAFANNNKIYLSAEGYIYSLDLDLTGSAAAVTDESYDYGACEVYDGKLYVSTNYIGTDTLRMNEKAILAYPINGDGSLGTPEEVINWTDDFAGSIISGLVFDNSGTMYVGTKTRTPIYVIEPVAGDYANGDISLLYPVLLKEEILSMRWDAGDYMAYISADADGVRTAYRLNMVATASPSYMP